MTAVDVGRGTAVAGPAPAPRAGLGRRLGAVVYEALLLGAIALVVEFALLPVTGPSGVGPGVQSRLYVPSASARWLSFACLFLLCGAYFAWSWSEGRRTLPMKTWRLGLRTTRGSLVGLGSALVRYLACWIGPALALITFMGLERRGLGPWASALAMFNFAWVLMDPDRQFLHDWIAGTRLVLAPSPPSSAVRQPIVD